MKDIGTIIKLKTKNHYIYMIDNFQIINFAAKYGYQLINK
jgi:hypothetical protein